MLCIICTTDCITEATHVPTRRERTKVRSFLKVQMSKQPDAGDATLTDDQYHEEMKKVKLLFAAGGISEKSYQKFVFNLQQRYMPEYNETCMEDIPMPTKLTNSPKKPKVTKEEKAPPNMINYDWEAGKGILVQLCDEYTDGIEHMRNMGYDLGARSIGHASGRSGTNAYRVCTKHTGCKVSMRLAWSAKIEKFTIVKDGANEHSGDERAFTKSCKAVEDLYSSEPEEDIKDAMHELLQAAEEASPSEKSSSEESVEDGEEPAEEAEQPKPPAKKATKPPPMKATQKQAQTASKRPLAAQAEEPASAAQGRSMRSRSA